MTKIKEKYIIKLMTKGHKNKCELILFKNFKTLQKKYFKESNEIFKISLINSASFFNLKKIKKRKKVLAEFPFFLGEKERIKQSLRNMTEGVTVNKIYNEIIDSACKNSKSTINKEILHKNSFLKKKSTNFRWF